MGCLAILIIFMGLIFFDSKRRDLKAALAFARVALCEYQKEYHHLPGKLTEAFSTNDITRLLHVDSQLTNSVDDYDGAGGFVYKPKTRTIGLNYPLMRGEYASVP